MEGSASDYEFTPAQNEVLAKASRWITLFAWTMILSAVIMTVGGVLSEDEGAISALIAAAVYFIIGVNFRSSARSMSEVVQTEGNDIDHLVTAVDDLGDAFQIMGVLILVGVTMVAASLVIFGAMYAAGGA